MTAMITPSDLELTHGTIRSLRRARAGGCPDLRQGQALPGASSQGQGGH